MKYVFAVAAIEASRWHKNGDHPLDYAKDTTGFEHGELVVFTGEHRRKLQWEGSIVRYYRDPNVPGAARCNCGRLFHEHGWIDTNDPKGGWMVCPGDYVITKPDGSYFPLAARDFEQLFLEQQASIKHPGEAKLCELWNAVEAWRDEYAPLAPESLLQVDSVNDSLPELAEAVLHIVGYSELEADDGAA